LFFDQEDFWTNDRIEAYLGGVSDPTEMIILDLFSEAEPQWQRTQSYYGKRWVWCLLHDYGGNMGLEGNLIDLTVNPLYALKQTSSMAGVGLSMEGQEGNEIVYNLLLDQAWVATSLDSAQYVVDWVERRYGVNVTTPGILQAWDLLRTSAYNNTYADGVNSVVKSIYVLSPAGMRLTRLGIAAGDIGVDEPYWTSWDDCIL
jgi:alpha-N-acetylglucosaminidase